MVKRIKPRVGLRRPEKLPTPEEAKTDPRHRRLCQRVSRELNEAIAGVENLTEAELHLIMMAAALRSSKGGTIPANDLPLLTEWAVKRIEQLRELYLVSTGAKTVHVVKGRVVLRDSPEYAAGLKGLKPPKERR